MSASQQSPWQSYVPRIEPQHRHWLTDAGSLTLKLKRHSNEFQVIRTFQAQTALHLSEQAPLQLRLADRVMSRNVILCCDQQPVVFGHTVTALATLKRHWPFFNGLGQKALGLALFFNPLIQRQAFEFTRLSQHDMLYQLAQRALAQHAFSIELPQHLWARRCVFTHLHHPNSKMMVTEVMLPAVYALKELRTSLSYEHAQ